MEEHPDLDHAATKRIIENILKSVDLSDQATRKIFKPFFVLFKDSFKTDDEILKTWMSLYTENSDDELDVIRKFWIKHIAQGWGKIEKLEIIDIKPCFVNDIKLILETVKDKVQVLTIKQIHYLEQNKFSKILGDFLKNNDALAELTLHNVGLDLPVNMQNFANGLKHAKLKTLNIPHNNLRETCAKILAEGLRKNKSVETLDISNNSLGHEGLAHLADALKKNNTLVSLDISGNYLQTKGFEHLAAALIINKALKKIFICDDWTFKPSDRKLLLQAIKERGVALEIFDMRNTKITIRP